MNKKLLCYRCGESLSGLTLPLSRQDECPRCASYMHVCRMCENYDATVTRQCKEDGAEDVLEKTRPNFCDWFIASFDAFNGKEKELEDRARRDLDALFGGSGSGNETATGTSDADKLFK